ncbi:cyclase family protein [Zhouia spongiae]|uniref:Cyclase family protein n=1 Tax=Zhouia spongiae TaxID=2202721 RepID=A0ABY3YQM1_9FLAO|nr:cyclase family protein [Zhouia spongiae]UNY99423.1 cyclase family protein [Zhouia spongiae]
MKAIIHYKNKKYPINFNNPIDISIPIRNGEHNVNAWYVGPPVIEPVKDGDFTGAISAGATTNFNAINVIPHAHGTHTECLGHITEEFFSVNEQLKKSFFMAEVVTVAPGKVGEDFVIPAQQLKVALHGKRPEAVVIRTLPNYTDKLNKQYAHTNPPYLEEAAANFLKEKGVKHLLIDLPSVDKEKDEGRLLAHKAFWNFEGIKRYDATITEFIFVPNHIKDGSYFLNIQIAPFENDASPSKPILYQIEDDEE